MEKRTIKIYDPIDYDVMDWSGKYNEPIICSSGDIWHKDMLGKKDREAKWFFQSDLNPKVLDADQILSFIEENKLEIRNNMDEDGNKWIEVDTEYGSHPMTDKKHGFKTVREAVSYIMEMEEQA